MRKRMTDRLIKAKGAGLRREISDDFKYNAKKLKHVKHILHNISVALGTLTSALNEFSRIKGRDISPDGLVGGLGYIMPLKDIKESLINGIKSLSEVSDSLADELTNPRWNAKDDKEVKELIKEKEEVEEKVEEGIEPTDVVDNPDSPESEEENTEEIPAEAPAPEEPAKTEEPAEKPAEPQSGSPEEISKEASIKLSDIIEDGSEKVLAKSVKSNLKYFHSLK